MSSALKALGALCVALALCAVASAGTGAAREKLAITIKPAPGTFALSLGSGRSVARDSGRVTWNGGPDRIVRRAGQRVRLWAGDGSFVGKRGTLELRFRWEWFDAGRGFESGVGTWTVIGGTGAYAGLRGAGPSAAVWAPSGPTASRMDGFVRQG